MTVLIRVLIVGLVFVGASPAASEPVATGSISGTVTDESATPLERVDVTVCSVDYWCDIAFTDAAGSYTVNALPPGDYRVRFAESSDTHAIEYYDDAPDRESATLVSVVAGADTSGIDAVLTLGGSVSGVVTDESANPLTDMFVVACTTDDTVCKSTFSEAGPYTVGGLPTGEYIVEFSDPFFSHYLNEFYDDVTDWESATLVQVTAGADTPGIDAALGRPGSVSGTVTDVSANPLEGIDVALCTQSWSECWSASTTDATGAYTVGGLPPGEYVVEFYDPFPSKYLSEYYDDVTESGSVTLVRVTAGVETSGINAELALGGSVSGTVTDASANPLEGIDVEVCSESWFTCWNDLTDAAGVYTVGGLPTDDHTVFFYDPSNSYFEEYHNNVVSPDSATLVSVVAGLDTSGIDAVLVHRTDGTFVDTAGSVFEADIEWLFEAGITRGCGPSGDRTYCPDEPVTRGQMAAFLVRALELTDDGSGDLFTDDDTSIFETDIDRLATAGITRGCNPPDNTRFCPEANVTRGQMAAFLVRALELTDDGSGDLFTDDDASIFESDIDRLATAGITRGCNPPNNTRFCPEANVTRGQMAAFLHRALGDALSPAGTNNGSK